MTSNLKQSFNATKAESNFQPFKFNGFQIKNFWYMEILSVWHPFSFLLLVTQLLLFFIANPFYVMLVGSALSYGTQKHAWIKEILATLTQTGNNQSR